MAAPTTSGTVAFKLDILQLCEEAYERAGTEMRTGYDLRSARRSLNIMLLDWVNRGLNLWTVKEATISLVAGTKTYSLADDCVDVLDAVLRDGSGASQTDYNLTRLSVSTYAQTSNKNTSARPTSMYVDRQNRATVTLYPEPNDGSQTFCYWYVRRIEDAGDNTNNADMPERFIPALISGLAFNIALKRPELEQRMPVLKALYEEAYELAASEDRTKANLVFTPLQDFIDVDLT
tara:strand:- start:198 stop:899 length:702 start_codon:yes stop_codon:yes gene_type:complete